MPLPRPLPSRLEGGVIDAAEDPLACDMAVNFTCSMPSERALKSGLVYLEI